LIYNSLELIRAITSLGVYILSKNKLVWFQKQVYDSTFVVHAERSSAKSTSLIHKVNSLWASQQNSPINQGAFQTRGALDIIKHMLFNITRYWMLFINRFPLGWRCSLWSRRSLQVWQHKGLHWQVVRDKVDKDLAR